MAIQEGILWLAEKRFKIGTASELDAKQAKTVLEATRSTIPALQIVLGQANDQLCILLGLPPCDLAARLGPGPDVSDNPLPNTPAWLAAGVPADLLRRRPDVRSAERQVAAQLRRSASPRRIYTRPWPSTAPWVTNRPTFPSCSSPAVLWETSRPASAGTF